MTTTKTPAEQGTEQATKEQLQAQKLTERIVTTIKSVDGSLEKVGELLAQAKETNAHTLTGHSNWQSYCEAVIAASDVKWLGPVLRNQLLRQLVDHGMSVRSAARATGTSAATASRAVNGTPTGEGKPGANAGVPKSRRSKSQIAVDAISDAIKDMDKATLEDLVALQAKLSSSVQVVSAAIATKRDAAAAKAKADAEKAARQSVATQGTNARTGEVQAAAA